MEFTQLFLMTNDFEATLKFYKETLNLSVEREKNDYVAFDTGASTIVIEADFPEETLAAFRLSPSEEPRGSGAIFVLEVEDVDAVYTRLQEHDANTLFEPKAVDWGRKMFLVRDPTGYVIEISQPIDEEKSDHE